MKSISSILLLITVPFSAVAQSPYSLRWTVDGPLLGATGAFAVSMVAFDRHLPGLTDSEISALSRDDINAFDRGATAYYSSTASDVSTVLEVSLALFPFALLAEPRVREDAVTVGGMYLETLALATLLPQLAKGAIDRPYVYNPGVSQSEKTDPDARRSFFSGHTTFAFSMAVFVSTVYGDFFPGSPWAPYVWAGSLSLAAGVGILRITSGQHFPTDVITGAVVGSAVGYLVPLLHRTEAGGVRLSPSWGPGGPGVSVVCVF
jgi:membrane-associated phospholipid phosphatase